MYLSNTTSFHQTISFYRGSLSFLTLHISNIAIASFVVVYYIPYTLQWCGVGENDCWNWQITSLGHNLHVTLSFETFLPFEISFQLKMRPLRLKPCKRIANINLHTRVNLHTCKFTHCCKSCACNWGFRKIQPVENTTFRFKNVLPGVVM